MHSRLIFFLFTLSLLAVNRVKADENTNTYNDNEPVKVYGNTIGPQNNAFETYGLFTIPGCPPVHWKQKEPTLGQALVGDEFYELNVTINYGKDVENGVMCHFTPTKTDVEKWRNMIYEEYVYQLLVDELPLWAMFGKVVNKEPMIYLHREFNIGINDKHIVNVSMETSKLEQLQIGKEYIFTYSVKFSTSVITFENRFIKYLDGELFEPRIRWFAIGNSLILIVFLVVVVTMILSRVLRTDYQRIEHELRMRDEGNDDLVDSTGWKQLYADVHRVPTSPTLLSAFIGTGVQLAVVFIFSILIAAMYSLRRKPTQDAVTVITILYAFSGIIAGFISSMQFLTYSTLSPALSKKWMRCMEFTMLVFPLFLVFCGTITNIVAHLYDSARAVHIGGVTFVIFILLIGFCPSVVLGTLLGRYYYRRRTLITRGHRDVPHVNQIPRLIPPSPSILLSNIFFIPLCGLLPFGSIAFELCLMLSSMWLNKPYHLYTFLLITFVMFVVVTCCVSIAGTYVLLNIEYHKWPWVSFGFGASCGFYVYLYAIYFYTFRTSMSGFFTLLFFFTYSATLSAAISLIGGSVAFLAASFFIKKIYAILKSD